MCTTRRKARSMELVLVYNEKTGLWEKKKDPYITIEVETKKDFEELQKAWEFWNKHKEDEANAGNKGDCADGSAGTDGTVPMG